jgi:hypothetical protein
MRGCVIPLLFLRCFNDHASTDTAHPFILNHVMLYYIASSTLTYLHIYLYNERGYITAIILHHHSLCVYRYCTCYTSIILTYHFHCCFSFTTPICVIPTISLNRYFVIISSLYIQWHHRSIFISLFRCVCVHIYVWMLDFLYGVFTC